MKNVKVLLDLKNTLNEMCNLSESIIREYSKIVILSRFTTDLKNVFFRNMEVLANL